MYPSTENRLTFSEYLLPEGYSDLSPGDGLQREARFADNTLWNKMKIMKSMILAGEGDSQRFRDLIQEGPVASQLDKFKLLYSQINLATLMVIHDNLKHYLLNFLMRLQPRMFLILNWYLTLKEDVYIFLMKIAMGAPEGKYNLVKSPYL